MTSKFLSTPCLAAAGLVSLAAVASAGEVDTGYFGDVAIKGYDPVAYFTDGKAVRGARIHFLRLARSHMALFERRTSPLIYREPGVVCTAVRRPLRRRRRAPWRGDGQHRPG